MKRILSVFVLAVFALTACCNQPEKVSKAKNVIFMVSDGTSTSLLSIARWYKQSYIEDMDSGLEMDPYLCGSVRAYHKNAPIGGSPGSMTTFMTGMLGNYSDISVYPKVSKNDVYGTADPELLYNPLATYPEVLQKELGKSVGLVTTVEFTHATPAACFGHTADRNSYDALKMQMASQDIDLVFSGGAYLVDEPFKEILKENGTSLYVNDLEGFRNHNEGKIWSLWGKTMDYELDRNPQEQPSLKEMTEKALEYLSKDKDGFFLMVEGGKVDYAAHANDPIALIYDFIAFDEALGAAMEFAQKDGNTVVIALSDHGNSGVNFAKKGYKRYTSRPFTDVVGEAAGIKVSNSKMEDLLMACEPADIPEVFKEHTGIELSDKDLVEIFSSKGFKAKDHMDVSNSRNLQNVITDIYCDHTNIAFLNGNHTGEDVFLAAYHPKKSSRLEGWHTNVEVNEYLCEVSGLKKSLSEYTKEYYVKHTELFDDAQIEILNPESDFPTLVVTKNGKTLKAEAQRAGIEVGGENKTLSTPVVYIPETKAFYLPAYTENMLN